MSEGNEEVVTGETEAEVVEVSETTPPVESDEVVKLRSEVSGLKSAASSERHKRQTAEKEVDRLNTAQTATDFDPFDPKAIDRAVESKMAQVNAQQQQVEQNKQWDERIESGQKKHADVNIAEVIQDDTFYPHISNAMAEVIRGTEDGIDVMLHLNANRDQLHQIAQLSPMQAAQQLGRISEQLKAAGNVPISNAPTPITPVGSTSVSGKSRDDMSHKEYEADLKERNSGSVFPRR